MQDMYLAGLSLASNQALLLHTTCCTLAKEGESLVHFDHMLDVVGLGYQLVVDFAHALPQLMPAMTQHFKYGEAAHEQWTIPKDLSAN